MVPLIWLVRHTFQFSRVFSQFSLLLIRSKAWAPDTAERLGRDNVTILKMTFISNVTKGLDSSSSSGNLKWTLMSAIPDVTESTWRSFLETKEADHSLELSCRKSRNWENKLRLECLFIKRGPVRGVFMSPSLFRTCSCRNFRGSPSRCQNFAHHFGFIFFAVVISRGRSCRSSSFQFLHVAVS